MLAWQTCEVPHVATHEANRGLAALTLCDAYRNGGTMEIRFDWPGQVRVGDKSVRYAGHVEGQVPASLRRYARTVGVTLGTHDRGAIFPDEARALFLAVTPMPASLAARATTAMSDYGIPPERLGCFRPSRGNHAGGHSSHGCFAIHIRFSNRESDLSPTLMRPDLHSL